MNSVAPCCLWKHNHVCSHSCALLSSPSFFPFSLSLFVLVHLERKHMRVKNCDGGKVWTAEAHTSRMAHRPLSWSWIWGEPSTLYKARRTVCWVWTVSYVPCATWAMARALPRSSQAPQLSHAVIWQLKDDCSDTGLQYNCSEFRPHRPP